MRNLTPFLIVSFSTTLGACAPEPETGIDRTVLSGTVQITPHLSVEDESVVGVNDAIIDNLDTEKVVEMAQDLGLLGHRYSLVDGTCHTFSAERDGPPTGDFDYYTFKPQFSGTITVGLTWADAEITDPKDPPAEEMVWHLSAYDVDGVSATAEELEALEAGEYITLYDSTTDGSYGNASFSLDVQADSIYAIRVAGRRALGDSDAYRLSISGFDPNGWDDGAGGTTGTATVLVGAYTSNDVTNRGNPVGGTSVESFVFDAETLTWSGDYTMWYIQSVTTTEVTGAQGRSVSPPTQNDENDTGDTASSVPGDTGSSDTGTGDTGSGDTGSEDTGANDTGNSGSNDTGSDGSGSSDGGEDTTTEPEPEPQYSTVVDGNLTEVWIYAGTFPNLNSGIPSGTLYSAQGTQVSLTSETIDAVSVNVDTIQPKLIGWTYTETEPNEPNYDDKSGFGTENANYAGEASGPGYVDILTGTITMTGAVGYSEHDEDLISLTVPTEVYLSITLDWDTTDDIDYYVLGPKDGDPTADYEDDSDYYAQPEFGVTRDLLIPGETYYIWVAGYSGTDQNVANYTVELEYLAP